MLLPLSYNKINDYFNDLALQLFVVYYQTHIYFILYERTHFILVRLQDKIIHMQKEKYLTD